LFEVETKVQVHRNVVNPVEEDQMISVLSQSQSFDFGEFTVVGSVEERRGSLKSQHSM
jgi:hypothetical protein